MNVMRSKFVTVIAVGLLGVPLSATATIYSFSDTADGFTATGTITTDGYIGVSALSAADITAFQYTITGPGITPVNGSGTGGTTAIYISGLDLTATASALFFNYDDPGSGIFNLRDAESGVAWVSTGARGGPDGYFALQTEEGLHANFDSGTHVIIASAVPEPAAAWLILSGLAGLGLTGWRRGQTAAV